MWTPKGRVLHEAATFDAQRASRRAHDLGVSRSEFFSRAASRYLDALDDESITRQIDQAIAEQTLHDDSALDTVAVGQHLLDGASGEW